MEIKSVIANMLATTNDEHKLWIIYVFIKKLLGK